MPARRGGFSLPPTARTSRPNTVLRTAQAAAATITAIRMTWNGTPATRPRPMNWKSGRVKVWRLPLVITCAMPRPAMNRTSVPMIGWMRKRVISQPLKSPNRPAARTGRTKASAVPTAGAGIGNRLLPKIKGARAPLIAMREPTESLFQPVSMTSVMPTLTTTIVQTWVRLTFSVSSVAKWGVKARLKAISNSRARSVPKRARSWPGRGAAAAGATSLASVTRGLLNALAVRHGVHDGGLGDGLAGQLGHADPVAEHGDAVGALDHLLELGGDHQHTQALLGQLADQALDLGLRPHVDAAGGLVEDRELRVGGEPAGEQPLLLVAARELADALLGAGAFHAEAADEAVDDLALPRLVDDAGLGEAGQEGEGQVLAHRHLGDDTLDLAVLRDETDAGPDGVGRLVEAHRAALEAD